MPLNHILGNLTCVTSWLCFFQGLVSPTLPILDALQTLFWFLGAYKVMWEECGVPRLGKGTCHPLCWVSWGRKSMINEICKNNVMAVTHNWRNERQRKGRNKKEGRKEASNKGRKLKRENRRNKRREPTVTNWGKKSPKKDKTESGWVMLCTESNWNT